MTHHDDARLDALLAQLGDGDTKDLFRLLLERGMQELIDAELTASIGAELHERTDTRTNQRNGVVVGSFCALFLAPALIAAHE